MPCIFRPKSVAHIPVDFISIPIYSHSLSVIKETYRKLALRWHTGKKTNHLDEANRRFRGISESLRSFIRWWVYTVQCTSTHASIVHYAATARCECDGDRAPNPEHTHTKHKKTMWFRWCNRVQLIQISRKIPRIMAPPVSYRIWRTTAHRAKWVRRIQIRKNQTRIQIHKPSPAKSNILICNHNDIGRLI